MKTVLNLILGGFLSSNAPNSVYYNCTIDNSMEEFEIKVDKKMKKMAYGYVISVDVSEQIQWLSIKKEDKEVTYNINCKKNKEKK